MKKTVAKIKKALTPKQAKATVPLSSFLSTGSTLLNLACSGRRTGGFFKGCYIWLVGDSESGKTFLSHTCLAEASINENFEDYRFIVDLAEDGALMDIEHYFGKKAAKRIEPPAVDESGEPVYSSTVEEFFYHLDDAHKADEPFIYILDSMDALTTKDDNKKFEKKKAAARSAKKKEEPGSFGMSKAKLNSEYMRQAVGRLKRKGSILIVISQTRDNVGFGAQFAPKTSAGGRALKFYAHLELWSSVYKTLKREVKKQKVQQGIICRIAVKKNRVNGRKRVVDIPLYWSNGLDDVGSCVNWLIRVGAWSGSEEGAKVNAPDFDYKGSKEGLIALIEKEDREPELRKIVSTVWKELDEAAAVIRKRRYE